eukprot:598339-Heterocapsa_arctica.AAC.1
MEARRLVEVAERRHDAVAVAIDAVGVGALGAGLREGRADAVCGFRDQGALLQRVVDAVNAV